MFVSAHFSTKSILLPKLIVFGFKINGRMIFKLHAFLYYIVATLCLYPFMYLKLNYSNMRMFYSVVLVVQYLSILKASLTSTSALTNGLRHLFC